MSPDEERVAADEVEVRCEAEVKCGNDTGSRVEIQTM